MGQANQGGGNHREVTAPAAARSSGVRTKLLLPFLLLCIALPTAAQTKKPTQPAAQDSIRDRAIKRCKENRGTDCESREGLRE